MPEVSRRLTPRLAMSAQFFSFGLTAGLWGGSVPEVARAAHLRTTDLGTAFTLYSGGYIIAMMLAGQLLRYASPRASLLAANPVNMLCFAALMTGRSEAAVTMAFAAMGLLMGLIDLLMNREGTLVEADLRRPVLAGFHAMASLGGAVGGLSGSLLSAAYGPSSTLGVAMAVFVFAQFTIWRATPDRPPAPAAAAGGNRLMSRTLLVLGLVLGIDIAGETSAAMWSARLIEDIAPSLAAISGLGLSFFSLCQATMRFGGDRLRRAFGDIPLIYASLAVAGGGLTLVGLSPSLPASVAGFALVGAGSALLVPCIFARAAALVPERGGSALALLSMVAAPPRLLAPWAFGVIAAAATTQAAFGAIAVAFLVAFGLMLIGFGFRASTQD